MRSGRYKEGGGVWGEGGIGGMGGGGDWGYGGGWAAVWARAVRYIKVEGGHNIRCSDIALNLFCIKYCM